MLSQQEMRDYIKILREELIPATGCTEPIAVAYASAKARAALGSLPESMKAEVCGNIIKNVKSVVVPNTGGLRGIETSVAVGALLGDENAVMEVLSHIEGDNREKIENYMKDASIKVTCSGCENTFYIAVTAKGNGHTSRVVIENYHTNITLIERDGETIFASGKVDDDETTDRSALSVEKIIEFADTVEINEISDIITRQIELNSALSKAGIEKPYSARIGRILLDAYGENDVHIRARAAAAAGSDARMGGCEIPAVIVSGSGNQGMTASLPVVEYAKFYNINNDRLIRAVAVADLVTIHQKTGIGRLSAFCGAVSAGCGAGAGISYLLGGGFDEAAHTIVNALAIISGVVCDGAKPSCAAKIAAAVDAGILGYEMYLAGSQFLGGDGIITKGVDNTITNIGLLASQGMRETDKEILKLMVGDN